MKKVMLIGCLCLCFCELTNAQDENGCATVSWAYNNPPMEGKMYSYLLSVHNICNDTIVVTITHGGCDPIQYYHGITTHQWTLNPGATKVNHCHTLIAVNSEDVKFTVKKYGYERLEKHKDACTMYATLKLPYEIGSAGYSCSKMGASFLFDEGKLGLGVLDCKTLADIIMDPAQEWNGIINDCKVGLEKYKSGNYVYATFTISGVKRNVNAVYNKLLPSVH